MFSKRESEELYMLIMAPQVCSTLAPIWQIVGWVLFVFKIAVPLIIIIFGAIDLGKAVIASKDDEIKKSIKSLIMRAIAGIVIFFIPSLVGAIFSMVNEFSDPTYKGEYTKCKDCVIDPGGSKCEGHVAESKNN